LSNLIINVRGWSGSGKSTIIQKLLNHFRKVPCYDEKGKCNGYCIKTPRCKTFVVGKYTATGGGCDTIHPVGKIQETVASFAKRGNVIFEGQMISTIAGRWIELADQMPECKFVFLVLDTPLERCLKRIKKRREARGNFKPFNPKPSNLKHYDEARYSSPENLRKGEMDVRVIDHKRAYEYILRLLGE
jgi:thymidylate kinase